MVKLSKHVLRETGCTNCRRWRCAELCSQWPHSPRNRCRRHLRATRSRRQWWGNGGSIVVVAPGARKTGSSLPPWPSYSEAVIDQSSTNMVRLRQEWSFQTSIEEPPKSWSMARLLGGIKGEWNGAPERSHRSILGDPDIQRCGKSSTARSKCGGLSPLCSNSA